VNEEEGQVPLGGYRVDRKKILLYKKQHTTWIWTTKALNI